MATYNADHVKDWSVTDPVGSTESPALLDSIVKEIKRCIENDLPWSFAEKTGAYSATSTDTYLELNASAGDVAITLPSSATQGKVYILKCTSIGGTYTASILTAGSETIDGNASYVFSQANEVLAVYVDDSADYKIIYHHIPNGTPVGAILPYAGTTAPAGWLLCDGTTGLSTTANPEYTNLFNVIGTSFGGAGATDFDLPDLRGRTVIGLDNLGGVSANNVTHANADTLGGGAGAEAHTLTEGELASHHHSVATKSSAWEFLVAKAGFTNAINDTGTGVQAIEPGFVERDGHDTDVAGSDNDHNNMQPYMALGYIIKL